MPYKYELHCHTGCTSRCGRVEPERIVELYKNVGYSGIVVTDHYSPMTFTPNWSPQKQVDFYLNGYRRMKKAAGEDFTVLLGMELRHYATANDYLIYGITEEFIQGAGNLMMKGADKMREFCDENGFLLFQAHPFRNGMHIVNPEYLDGVEIYNACVRHNSRNAIAEKWAKLHKLRGSAGSDFHRAEDVARGGILTDKKIETNADLLEVLKSGSFTVYKK